VPLDAPLQAAAPIDAISAPARIAPPPINMQALSALGTRLVGQFKTYENHRKLAEQKWARNLRQFLGEYDPEIKKQLDPERSQAYPRLTRVKVVSMVARLMNLLFPTTEKNWGIGPSPVPNLTMQDLQVVLQQAVAGAQQAQKQVTDAVIEAAIRAFAKTRAENLEREIEDQLAEIGGARNYPYVAQARKVLFSGVLYGAGVLGGPFVRTQAQRRWAMQPGGMPLPQEYTAFRPQFEFVPLWDYYPDMTARHVHQMDGQFRRLVLSKAQLRELADRGDFFGDVIKAYLVNYPKGNWKERSHETELRTMGVSSNVNVMSGSKYEVIVWQGFVDSATLRESNIELPQGLSKDMVDADVWMIDDKIIKADLSPWVELEPDQRVQQYHHFIFEEDDSNLLGNGLPNIMRDSQMGVAAATRMLMDNASIVCGPNLEVNTELLRGDTDSKSIVPYKIWYRTGQGAEATVPAVKNIQIEGHIAELKEVVALHEHFADMETFVNPQTGGDMQKGPSEPFRTAAGASMLRGEMSLPFKDVVRNFDNFTISVINALLLFNKHFNENAEVRGDFTPIARGSSSLIAKELRGMALDQMSQTLLPEEKIFVDFHKVVKEKMKVRDVDVSDVLVDEDEAARRLEAQAQKQAQDTADMRRLFAAEVRKLLADASKSLTQADKNTAASETEFYNTILKGLESGVTPIDIEAARAGAGVPPAIARSFRRTSGADPAPTATNGNGSD
jgi:uncharacterized tellurite resistance protein B-like protein